MDVRDQHAMDVDLLEAVETRCASRAAHIQTVPVRARIDGVMIWDVDVHVFEVVDCDKTRTAYAWRSERNVFTALDIGPIRSPSDAVCAMLADSIREKNLALAAR